NPEEKRFYLAGKLYYEPDALSEEDKKEIYVGDHQLNENVEWEFLRIKYMREEVTPEEIKRISQLIIKKDNQGMDVLDKYLKEAGSSLSKLAKENLDQAAKLLVKVNQFKERRLSVLGKTPMYLDIDGYLHIYMRHVEEFKINKHFEHKDNFQWNEGDVFMVMEQVIHEIENDIQAHFEKRPGQRYSRYGRKSVYFQGDYYTLHI